MFYALLLSASLWAAELNVGSGQTYATITAALDIAGSGDTIWVHPGTYADVIDLRGRTIYLKSVDGPAVTNIVSSSPVYIETGSVEGFSFNPAPVTAVSVSGSANLRELMIYNPGSYGVFASDASPVIEEVAVFNAGLHAFIANTGNPTFRRSIAMGAASVGFAVAGSEVATVQNCISINSKYGFRSQNASHVFSNNLAVGESYGLVVGANLTFTNGVLHADDDPVYCAGGTPTFPNGIVNPATTRDCGSTVLNSTDAVDPEFVAWDAAATSLFALDLRPATGSPMIDAGSGSDATGGTADLGAFGGSQNDWTDLDGDGVPVLFDCDDHNADTYWGATEYADGRDNDCDGQVDDGAVSIDDTGTPADDTGEPAPAPEDLDGDGYFNDVDCDEHNRASYPGASELIDGADNDCDDAIDEGTAASDDDGDGFSEFSGDCDDNNPERYPGGRDDRIDGLDNDCDGEDDNATGNDDDGDGYLDSDGDCDDNDSFVSPAADEETDGLDNDCDGLVDEDTLMVDRDRDGVTPAQGDCNDDDPDIYAGAVDIPDDFIDQDCTGSDNYDVDRDGDPSATSGGTDCDDLMSTVAGTFAERCGDTVDNNCDTVVDEGCDTKELLPALQLTGCGECGGMRPETASLVLLTGLMFSGRRRRSSR